MHVSTDMGGPIVDMKFLTVIVVFVLAVLAVGLVTLNRARNKRRSFRQEALQQRLRNITFHDKEKIDRLIDFERQESLRKGRPQECLEDLMERAIERWERDNASAAAIY